MQEREINRLLDNAKTDLANKPKNPNISNNIKLVPNNNEVINPRKKEPTL